MWSEEGYIIFHENLFFREIIHIGILFILETWLIFLNENFDDVRDKIAYSQKIDSISLVP